MSIEEDSTGLKSGMPGPEMPYSVSMPMTLGMAITPSRRRRAEETLQVLPRVDPVDLPPLAAGVGHQRADVDDALALLPTDPGPVVGVGGVRQVLVLLELVPDRGEQVVLLQALLAHLEEPLDGHLLGPPHDVLDHGAGVEVLEVEDLLVARLVRDLQE